MHTAFIVSLLAHAALLAWGIISLPSPQPLDASNLESIPVHFVILSEETSIERGLETARPVEVSPEPEPEP
ncbi:MAG: hypothetical protein ACTSU0_09485, partial [Alphaproteobacteria bacterium]